MPKVIVERPRVHGQYGRKGRPARDLEELPAQQGIRRPFRYRSKDFNDHLAPLRRYLEKQVGRPWNKVFGEICERLDARSTMHRHLRLHVFQFVDLDVLHDPHRHRGHPGRLYVDRRTGLLRRAKQRKRSYLR
jgi:hypothetical protein